MIRKVMVARIELRMFAEKLLEHVRSFAKCLTSIYTPHLMYMLASLAKTKQLYLPPFI